MNLNETELLLKLLFFNKRRKMMIAFDVFIIEINASDQCDF